jgi:hypothetical protein
LSDHTKTLLTFYVHFSKNQAVKKWLPYELIFAVYLEYVDTSNFVWPYPILLTFYVQYTKNPAVKSGFQYIVPSNFFLTEHTFTYPLCSVHQ